MKVSELTGAQLDMAVARAEGLSARFCSDRSYVIVDKAPYCPSTNWTIGGPLIDREHISIRYSDIEWSEAKQRLVRIIPRKCVAGCRRAIGASTDVLQACMRAYVASKFSDEVPDEVTA